MNGHRNAPVDGSTPEDESAEPAAEEKKETPAEETAEETQEK